MSRRLTDKLSSWAVRLPSLPIYLEATQNRPAVGLSQGGSGRKDAGCRRAATNGLWKQSDMERLRRIR